jgi:hypothetical protein
MTGLFNLKFAQNFEGRNKCHIDGNIMNNSETERSEGTDRKTER